MTGGNRNNVLRLIIATCLIVNIIAVGNNNKNGGQKKEKVEYIRLPLWVLDEQPGTTIAARSAPTTTVPVTAPPVEFVNGANARRVVLHSQHQTSNFIGGQSRSVGEVKNASTVLLSNSTRVNIVTDLLNNVTSIFEDDDGEEDLNDNINFDDSNELNDVEEEDEAEVKIDDDEGEEVEEEEDKEEDDEDDPESDEFDELDLIDLVQALERQADAEEQTGIFPEILDILSGKQTNKNTKSSASPLPASLRSGEDNRVILHRRFHNGSENGAEGGVHRGNDTLRFNVDDDLQLGLEDFSNHSEDIVEGVSAGVEESLRMLDDLYVDDDHNATDNNATAQTRQFSVYLFQGQYYSEPRLNRFVDGALRNMGTEIRVSSMDPLYFRVLPRGQVAERERPLMIGGVGVSGVRRRRPGGLGGAGGGVVAIGRQHSISKRQVPAFFKLNRRGNRQQVQVKRKKVIRAGGGRPQVTRFTRYAGGNMVLMRKRNQQRLRRQRQKRRRQRQRQKKRRRQKQKRRKQQQQKNKNNRNRKKQNQLLQRIRRRTKQDVGGGRIEGISKIQRDGDAEMQLFGNYTLIRSHMRYGPIEITMQFRTKNGIRRSGATLPIIRAHTVTRVNHEGSEMIDFLLDRPHPETIRVRGALFPLAQRIARNIFARLFLPTSFLVGKLKEKSSLAFLSKPNEGGKR